MHSTPAHPDSPDRCLETGELALFVEGRASPEARRRLEQHVDRCPSCFDLVATLVADGSSGSKPSDDHPSASSSAMSLAPGTELDRFLLLDEVGRGAMGIVHAAYDRKLDRRVAIKLVRGGAAASSAGRTRMLKEARAMARVSHPNVVTVHEAGQLDDQVYVVMEFVEGQTLRAWAGRAPRRWNEVVAVFIQAGRGLVAAHSVGVIHRDFKPDNVLLDEHGRVRVVDFGLARTSSSPLISMTNEDPVPPGSDDREREPDPTMTGAVVGTPAYMAPEQWGRRELDERTDQFCFCVALYEALYGQRPFEGSNTAQLAEAVRNGKRRDPPAGARVPARVHRAVVRGLATDPGDRWPTLEALLDELTRASSPRGARWLAIAAACGVLLAAATSSYFATRSRCEGARAQLDGIWDDARREQVQTALLATERSYAPDTWSRVQRTLDGYAEAWVTKHTEVCEATSIRAEQSTEAMDLRMGCLQRHRIELRAAVRVLAEADATRMARAVKLVSSLPELSRCDDLEALEAALPPPTDPEVAARVESLRAELALVRSLDIAGDYDEGLALSRTVVEQADAIDYPPLRAEALLCRGMLLDATGAYVDATEDLEQAYLLAAQQGHQRALVAAAAELTYVVGSHRGEHEQGLWWGKTALATSRSLRDEPLAEARASTSLALVYEGRHELDQALDHHRRALAIREDVLGTQHPHVATSLNGIGTAQWKRGQHDQALASYRRALSIWEEAFGPRHPDIAQAVNNIGTVLASRGEFEVALEHFRRALDIKREALGPQHPDLTSSLSNIGSLSAHLGRLDEALVHFQRSLAIREQTQGTTHPAVASELSNIGVVLRDQGRLAEALEHHRRALAIVEETFEPGHAEYAGPLNNIATVLWDRGEREAALEHYRRALTIWEQALGPRHPNVAGVMSNIGTLLRERGELDEALEHHQRALEVRRAGLGETHPAVADSMAAIGSVLFEQGQLDGALDYHQRARAVREQALGDEHPSVAKSLDVMGQIRERQGDLEAARALHQRALTIREQALGGEHLQVASSLHDLARIALSEGDVELARDHARRAVEIAQAAEEGDTELAAARFTLARALWSDPAQRPEALRLARLARQTYERDAVHHDEQSEVDAWLERAGRSGR